MDPFHPYSCMHLELMHCVFQRTEWQLWVFLLVLPWATGGAEQQKCLQILLSFQKIVAQKHTQLPCQTIPLLKLCWARLVEKHKRISFSCCNIWPDWNDTIFCTYCPFWGACGCTRIMNPDAFQSATNPKNLAIRA